MDKIKTNKRTVLIKAEVHSEMNPKKKKLTAAPATSSFNPPKLSQNLDFIETVKQLDKNISRAMNYSAPAKDLDLTETSQKTLEQIFPAGKDSREPSKKRILSPILSNRNIPPLRCYAEEKEDDFFAKIMKAKYLNRNVKKKEDIGNNDYFDDLFPKYSKPIGRRGSRTTSKNAKNLLEAAISLFQAAIPVIDDLSKKYNCEGKLRNALREASRAVEE